MGWRDWFKGLRKRRRIPAALWRSTVAQWPFLAALSPDEQARLKQLSEDFLRSKEFTAASGLQLSDALCVAIAAQGCLPILNLGLRAYGDWVGIIVYPDTFTVPRRVEDEDGVVHEYSDEIAGEAWQGGPLLISWQDVQMAGNGYNVVIHEFAHKLDMLNGEADGIPALHSGIAESTWIETFDTALDDFCQRLEQGEETALDPYGATSPEEFFAVTSEAFFETPALLAAAYPALYTLLARYYRQDPLTRASHSANTVSTAAS